MFDANPYREELQRRIDTIRRMLDAADPPNPSLTGITIEREIRGVIILLLFASYENLLTSLCRGLLEAAASLKVGNQRLRVGFQQFAIHNLLLSISKSPEQEIWKKSGKKLLDCAFQPKISTINVNIFPKDGSFMKRSQVYVFCELFNIPDPGKVLMEVWDRLDSIVVERNRIAHGQQAPEEVGRAYSQSEIVNLVNLWEKRWLDFISVVELAASKRTFYIK